MSCSNPLPNMLLYIGINVALLSRVSGYLMMDKLEVPRRKVRKNWYVGLHPDRVDRSHPDVHDDSISNQAPDISSIISK